METPYQNREIDEKFTEIRATLSRIETQTTKTNGSVANLKMWKAYLTGATAVMMFLFTAILIPLITAYVSR